jgi:putative ABC transport system ATP-binding protein
MSDLIKTENLVKIYRAGEVEVPALRGVSLEMNPGEFVAIMGPSGSGKSTFMNLLGCLDRPTSGKFFLEGQDVSLFDREQLAEMRNKKIGFVFQGFNLLSRTSALDNVELPLLYNGLPSKDREQKARNALQDVGLKGKEKSAPNQLSGGEQQRVAIARALVNEPSLILADEPTGNLDTKTSFEIMDLLQKLNQKGITIILITHEKDIASFAKRNITFRDGRVLTDEKVISPQSAEKVLADLLPTDEEVEVK